MPPLQCLTEVFFPKHRPSRLFWIFGMMYNFVVLWARAAAGSGSGVCVEGLYVWHFLGCYPLYVLVILWCLLSLLHYDGKVKRFLVEEKVVSPAVLFFKDPTAVFGLLLLSWMAIWSGLSVDKLKGVPQDDYCRLMINASIICDIIYLCAIIVIFPFTMLREGCQHPSWYRRMLEIERGKKYTQQVIPANAFGPIVTGQVVPSSDHNADSEKLASPTKHDEKPRKAGKKRAVKFNDESSSHGSTVSTDELVVMVEQDEASVEV